MDAQEFTRFREQVAEHLGVPVEQVAVDIYIQSRARFPDDTGDVLGREEARERRYEIIGRAAELIPSGQVSMDRECEESCWSKVEGEKTEIILFHAKPEKREAARV